MSILFVVLSTMQVATAETPQQITQFVNKYCNHCHGKKTQKGDFRFDMLDWQPAKVESRRRWELVQQYVASGDMPPRESAQQPSARERDRFNNQLETLFDQADRNAKAGGTVLRRLNRVEYLNTVRDLFGIRMIKLPVSFPEESSNTEFDTMPEGTFLSPAVMEGYHDVATSIADRIVPLPNPPTYHSSLTTSTIGGDQTRRWFGSKKQFLRFTGYNHSGWVGGLWDSLFVAPSSGVYRVRLLANAQAESGADGKPLRVSFHAFDPSTEQLPKRFRIERAKLVSEQEIPSGDAAWVDCDVPLEAGETFHVYCANRFSKGDYPTGALNRGEISKALNALKKRPEPTIEVRGLEIEGPVAVLPRVEEFFGVWPPKLNRQELEARLLPLAERAYRRPLTTDESETLLHSVLEHGKLSGSEAFAWHYAIRRILCSPQFLYREAENTSTLSDYALASRLSYFLWSTMPDEELTALAASGRLSEKQTLADQTLRLLKNPRSDQFVQHFTGQWLGNRTVKAINVCDNRYQWDDNVRYGYVRATEEFFAEVLHKNLPVSTFIDSDFTYANSAMQVIWGMSPKPEKSLSAIAARQRQSLVWPEPERLNLIDLPQGTPEHVHHRGGILGLPGVLTVSGDGVESSPILRGVWVLENLFGQAPPPPPQDVPALDIDTSRATSVRETLSAHQQIESCAKCHREIDPLGLALENYDAIGGWRTKYIGDKTPIDVSSTMPDGTELNGVRSVKKKLLDNPKVFTRCLLTKLLEYGAGRELSVGDQRVIEELVRDAPESGYHFADLIIAATSSEVFRSK